MIYILCDETTNSFGLGLELGQTLELRAVDKTLRFLKYIELR